MSVGSPGETSLSASKYRASFNTDLDAAKPVCIGTGPAKAPSKVFEYERFTAAPYAELYLRQKLGEVADGLIVDAPNIGIRSCGDQAPVQLLGKTAWRCLQPPVAIAIMRPMDDNHCHRSTSSKANRCVK